MLLKFQLKNISIFYVQKRVGYNGVVFNLYKFRTMIANADDELQRILNVNEDARNEYAEYKKLKNDPRIIKGIGVFLRRSGLDEIPQFLNILKGDISIVGPRPYLKDELDTCNKETVSAILSVKPGITGLWQVMDSRNNSTFNERINIDLEYTRTRDILMDIKIFFKTIVVMINKSGV